LLNGGELEGSRRAAARGPAPSPAVRLFCSYSLRQEFDTHVKLLQRQGVIDVWHDRQIPPGDEWKGHIDDELERANIVVLLVSADFLASDYCYEIEMGRALARHEAGDACVIPVIVSDVNWRSAPFGRLQPLPKDGKAVATWGPDRYARAPAWRNVAEGIERVAKQLRQTKAAR
jgi:internalin A